MKIKIMRAALQDGLKKVQGIVGNKPTLQILANVKMETEGEKRLRLTATDLDVTIVANVECEVKEGGATTLPVKLLLAAVQKLPEGPVEIDVGDNDKAVIKCGSATFRLSGLKASDFPQLPEMKSGDDPYTFTQQVFREMIRKVSYALSDDGTRKVLQSMLLSFKDGKMTTVATDGRRLSVCENEISIKKGDERDILLPKRVVDELSKALSNDGDVKVNVIDSQIRFRLGEDMCIYSKMTDDAYPNFRQIIPDVANGHVKVTIDRTSLIGAVDRVAVLAMDAADSIRLTFNSNELIVSCVGGEARDEARDAIPIKYDGEKINVNLNPDFVTDVLKSIDEDDVDFYMSGGEKPLTVKCSVPFLAILMPLRGV